jgi:hypothetical protein
MPLEAKRQKSDSHFMGERYFKRAMIQIRDVLQVKFGKIDQAVELFTNPPAPTPRIMAPGYHHEVLTDISGTMYTLVNEFLVHSLAEFEAIRDQQFTQPEFDAWFKQFQLFIEGGRREYYNVEGAYEVWSRPGLVAVRESYRAYKWQIHMAVSLLQRYGALLVDRGVGQNPRILTDASGTFFKAIIEIETESMSTWESQRRALFREVEFQVWFNQLLTSVEAGTHEFYRVEYSSGILDKT